VRLSGTPFSSVEQLREIEQRIERDPDDVQLGFERARCLDDLGRVEDAMRAYRALLDVEPRHFGALTNLGTLFLEQGMAEGASACFHAALDSDWEDPLGHLNVALLAAHNGEYDAARGHFERVLRLFPDDAHARLHAHNGLSRLYERAGDEQRADEHLRLAFEKPIVWTFPYRGTGEPLRVLVLTSPRGGNVISNQFFDDRVVERVVIVPEAFGDGSPLPAHHVIFNAIGEPDVTRRTLERAARLVEASPGPVINDPRAVLLTDRRQMMDRIAAIPTLIAPRTRRFRREEITAERLQAEGFAFPLLLRSPGFHAGDNFELIAQSDDLPAALAALPGAELYAIAFHDARGADGWVRKYRIAFIDGRPYPVHLAIAQQWKVHYFSGAMAESAEHRDEERRFLDDMDAVLGAAERDALAAVGDAMRLDYAGVDFGRDRSGRIIVFEANAAMAIYPPPDDPRWDYRRRAHEQAIAAVRSMLVDRAVRGGYTRPV
jgi:glutathione synthase/RimK-type ligase-like ATP-grasp enzyme